MATPLANCGSGSKSPSPAQPSADEVQTSISPQPAQARFPGLREDCANELKPQTERTCAPRQGDRSIL